VDSIPRIAGFFVDIKESAEMMSIAIIVIVLAAGALTWWIKAQERKR